MKEEAKCYLCGKHIFVHDYGSTDICPECMSFIDVEKAKAALQAELSEQPIAEQGKTETDAGQESGAGEIEKELSSPFEREEKDSVASLGENPEKEIVSKSPNFQTLLDEHDDRSPGCFVGHESRELHDHPKGEEKADWKTSWQKVLDNTRNLVVFSNFSAVREDAKRAFRAMGDSERRELGAQYKERLEKRRKQLNDRVQSIEENGAGSSTVQGQTDNKNQDKAKKIAAFAVTFVFAFIFFIVIISLATTEGGAESVTGFVFGFMVFVALLIGIIVAVNRKKKKETEQSSFVAQSERTDDTALQQERQNLLREIDEIDWLLGFLKY